jgi:hypothetical protein
MTDSQPPVTRLGPESGGRAPGEGNVRVYTWEWGTDDQHRPGLPWIGIFLLVFGGLLLLQQLFPQFQAVGSVIVLAIGLAFLVKWAVDRGAGSLYAGAIITALALPGLLNAAGIEANGLTTFFLGVAFLFIAAVRLATGRRTRMAALVRRPAGGHRWRPDRERPAGRLHPARHPGRARAAAHRAGCRRITVIVVR